MKLFKLGNGRAVEKVRGLRYICFRVYLVQIIDGDNV
jgi:hypothetical protein